MAAHAYMPAKSTAVNIQSSITLIIRARFLPLALSFIKVLFFIVFTSSILSVGFHRSRSKGRTAIAKVCLICFLRFCGIVFAAAVNIQLSRKSSGQFLVNCVLGNIQSRGNIRDTLSSHIHFGQHLSVLEAEILVFLHPNFTLSTKKLGCAGLS